MAAVIYKKLPQEEIILKYVTMLKWQNWDFMKDKNDIPEEIINESEDQYAAGLNALQYLWAHPNTPPVIAIEQFADEMDRLSCEYPESIGRQFSVAYDVAMGILDIMIST